MLFFFEFLLSLFLLFRSSCFVCSVVGWYTTCPRLHCVVASGFEFHFMLCYFLKWLRYRFLVDAETMMYAPVGAVCLVVYPSQYPVDNYMFCYVACLDAHRFWMMLVDKTSTITVRGGHQKTDYVWWRSQCNHCSAGCDAKRFTYALILDMPFVWSLETVYYERKLAKVTSRHCEKRSGPTGPLYSLCYNGKTISDEWFVPNRNYLTN